MKLLTLIRHAKADSPAGIKSDFDRPLSPRGAADVPRVAGRYAPPQPPQWILVSSAARAMATARLFIDTCNYPASLLSPSDALYHADWRQLLALLQQTDEQYQHVAVVGHNPTISELSAMLSGQPDRFSPGTVATLRLDIPRWSALSSNCGERLTIDDPSQG